MAIRVVSQNGEPIVDAPKVNPDVIAHLERLLERAKGGQIAVVAFVAWGEHYSDQGYCGIEEHYEGIYLLGLLARLQRLVAERVDTLSAPVVEYPDPSTKA